MNSKECELSSIYKMKKPEDIPYNLPEGLSVYFYIEFYMQAMHILKMWIMSAIISVKRNYTS